MENKQEKAPSAAELYLADILNPDQLAIEGLEKVVTSPLVIECADGKHRIVLLDPPEDGWAMI